MAHPFGGHPTLARFVEFAQGHGCAAKVYYRTAKSGRAYQVLRINGPGDGCWAIISNQNTCLRQRSLTLSAGWTSRPTLHPPPNRRLAN